MDEQNQKEYEISFLLTLPEAEKELAKVLQENQAEVFYQKPAAELTLAYKIKKHAGAFFGFYHFRAVPANIKKIREALRLNQNVLRFLIITPPVKAAAPQPLQRPIRKAPEPVLSNEALEEKLEEILK